MLFGVLLIGCSKKSDPKPPVAATLVFPNKDSECTTGRDLSETTSEIEFKWMASDHTESYELRVTNLNTGITQTMNTNAISAKFSDVATSSTWHFYNAGYLTTHAPFPAQLVNPQNGASLFKDINNEVTLEWSAADVDNDIIGFELYFSTENPPLDLIAFTTSTKRSQVVGVSSNTTYYWRVITNDAEGNSSNSGVFTFKAL